MLAAATEWGNYGPLEYWVVGTEIEATQNIFKVNCKRRAERGQWRILAKYCDRPSDLEIILHAAFEQADRFEKLRKIGAEALSSGNPRMKTYSNWSSDWGM